MNRVISSDRILPLTQADRVGPFHPAPRQGCPAPPHCGGIGPQLLLGETMPYGQFIGVRTQYIASKKVSELTTRVDHLDRLKRYSKAHLARRRNCPMAWLTKSGCERIG